MAKLYKTCQDAFNAGTSDREDYPLREGEYKLREARYSLSGWRSEIDQITAFKKDKTKRHGLSHCTSDDAGYWLKRLPETIAHELGYTVLPGISALDGDGVSSHTMSILLHQAKQRAAVLVEQCESAKALLNQGINEEYKRMKMGYSSIAPILDQALKLIDTVLSTAGLVPLHYQTNRQQDLQPQLSN